jgi:hypothetical protein
VAERDGTAAGKPLWRRAFDAAEGPLGARLEELVRTGAFSEAIGLAARTRAGLQRALDSRTSRVWHLLNLPAASDVTRLRRQVAALDHELRRLTLELEHARRQAAAGGGERPNADRDEEAPDAGDPAGERAARPRRPAGPRPAGRRAQRAPRP